MGLEHPVELLDLVVELDLRDMGILRSLRIVILPPAEGAVPLAIDDLLHPPAVPHEVVGDVVDPLRDDFLQDHLDDPVLLDLDGIEEPALVNLRGDVGDLAEVGRVQKDGVLLNLKAAGRVDVAGEREDDGVVVAEGAQRRRTGGAGRGDAVMNAVGGLVGHDDVRLHRLEEAVHLVVLFIHPEPRLVLHDVALRDPGRPDVRPAVARDSELVELIPVEVEVLLVQGGILEVHVVVAGEAEDTGVLLQGDDVLQDLVFLLHDPPRPDRVLLVGRPLPLRRLRDVGTFEELVYKILDPHVGLSHPPAQAVEVGLEFVIADGHPHVVEGNVDQVAGDDVGVGDRFEQQGLDLLEGAVDVGRIDQLHARYHSIYLERSP